jgi:hypothetical protein
MGSRLCGDSCSDATRSLTPRTWQRYLAEWKGCIVPVRRLDVPCAAPACLAAHRTAAHRRRRAWCHERSMSHTEHHTDGARYAPARVPVYRMARRLAVSRPLRTMPREARSKAARYPNSSNGPSDERGAIRRSNGPLISRCHTVSARAGFPGRSQAAARGSIAKPSDFPS